MFCTKCGMKNDDEALFCAGCGSPLSQSQTAQPVENEQKTQGVSLEKVSTEEVVSEMDENSAGEAESAFAENVQVESVEPQNMEQSQDDIQQNFEQPQNFSEQQNFEQPQNFSGQQNFEQPQNFGGQQNFEQPQNFGGQQNFGQPQNFGTQQSFGQPQFANPQPVNNNFSVKRFIFSALIIIASIVACACIAFNYVGLEMSMKFEDEKDFDKITSKGYEIIKDDVDAIEDYDDEPEAEKLIDTEKFFRVMIIVFEVALVVFTVIDLILLLAVRKKSAYIFTMIFSLIKAGIGGFAMYLWCFKFLDQTKALYNNTFSDLMSYSGITMKLTATVGIGFILALSLQAVIFVCSIILLTCKNRQKVQPQA